MNGFLKGVMGTLLGWLNPLLSSAWGVVNGRENLLTFIGGNWKGLVLFLCLAGILIDLMVYLFRWKPWRVWRSFWERMRNPVPAPVTGASDPPEAPDTRTEEPPAPAEDPGARQAAWEEDPPVRRRRRSRRHDEEAPGGAFYDPYYPPQWQEPGTLGTARRPDE